MTLYLKNNNYEPWRGERIDEILHPHTIEFFWTDEELDAIGLSRTNPNDVQPEPIPYDPTNQNILEAPEQGFGGPTAKEILNGNR